VRYEELVYPAYETALLDAYDHRFESVYIVLHPFVRMPASFAWRGTQQTPSVDQIVAQGAKCPWSKVIKETSLASFAKISQALLTSSGSLADYLCDYPARDAVHAMVQSGSVWMPEAGRFEPLLREDFLAAFEAACHDRIASERNLEGFYATALTEHNWFNYTMGCATVTVGP
jgi:hypothetical protein